MEKKSLTPFQLVLILLAVLLGGGVFAYGFLMPKRAFDQSALSYRAQNARLTSILTMEGKADSETVNKLEKSLVAYKGKVEAVHNSLKFASVDEFKEIAPAAFAKNLSNTQDAIKATYAERGIELPENWYVGFEKYTTMPAPRAATGVLNYQLGALQWLHELLAKHEPEALTNLYRKPVSEEVSTKADKKKPAQKALKEDAYRALPMQLTFIADEANVRAFLNELVKSNQYLFAVDTIKLQEVVPEIDEEDEEETEEAEEVNSGIDEAFDNFFDQEDSGAEEEGEEIAAIVEDVSSFDSNEKLFEQVLGQEQVACFIDLNLVYLPSELVLPEITSK